MNSNAIDTNALIQTAASGDSSARARLLERFRPRLANMVSMRMDRRIRARFDASDVVQEALVIADKRLSEYLQNQPIAFYPWIRHITWEQLLKFHERHIAAQKRSVQREAGLPPPINDESICQLAERLVSNVSNPSGKMIRQETRERIRSALNQLDSKDREVIELLYLEQLKVKEVVQILGISHPTVAARHMRAIKRLTQMLE